MMYREWVILWQSSNLRLILKNIVDKTNLFKLNKNELAFSFAVDLILIFLLN